MRLHVFHPDTDISAHARRRRRPHEPMATFSAAYLGQLLRFDLAQAKPFPPSLYQQATTPCPN